MSDFLLAEIVLLSVITISVWQVLDNRRAKLLFGILEGGGLAVGLMMAVLTGDYQLSNEILAYYGLSGSTMVSILGLTYLVVKKAWKKTEILSYYDDGSAPRFYITGDTHRDFARIKAFCRDVNTRKKDVLIILGDAGINYYEDDRDVRLKRELANLNITLFCLHGNKEKRPEEIATYGVRSFCGGQVYYEPAYPNIFFAMDGETYVFEGKKYLAIGGAHSVDRYRCIESHLPYWENETPDDRVKQKVDAVLKRENGHIHGFLTHTCPMKYFPREMLLSLRQMNIRKPLLNRKQSAPAKLDIDRSTEEWLDCIEGRTEYSIWFCGHYHTDKQIDKLVMMYHEIRPLHMEAAAEIDQ